MKKLITQFHATPSEMAEYLERLRIDMPCSLALIGNRLPILYAKSEPVDFQSKIDDAGDVRIVLSSKGDMVWADSPNKLLDANPNCLVMDIGKRDSDGLEESCLSARIDPEDDAALQLAAFAFSQLKKITKAGAVAVNPSNGAEAAMRTHRFTKGAKVLFDEGGRMKPVGGNAIIKLI
jgi:hypothetical protein